MLLFDFIICLIGIYVPFIIYNLIREDLTKTTYRWKWSFFLVLIQCIFNIFTALFKYLAFRSNKLPQDAKEVLEKKKLMGLVKEEKLSFMDHLKKYLIWSLIGFATVMSMVLSTSALRYVNYPTQILARSCKPIPVMLFSVILAKERYPLYRYLVVGGICVGVSLFFIGQAALKANKYSGKSNTSFDESIMGYVMLIGSLAMDGICNGLQQRLKKLDKPSEEKFMLMVNLTGSIFLMAYLGAYYDQEVRPALEYMRALPRVSFLVFGCALSACLGTIFIFKTVATYGTLVLSILTTTRKFFTLLFSVFWNGHEMSSTMWTGVFVVFGSLFYDVYRKYFKSFGDMVSFMRDKIFPRPKSE